MLKGDDEIMKQIIIDCDENQIDITVEEVLKLIKEGCTSGIDPTWEIKEVE